MKILVLCGAGASSTFIAQRLRRAAADAGLDWQAIAGGDRGIADHPDADMVLLGPHLAARLPDLARSAPRAIVAVLDADISADLDGSRTLARVRGLLSDNAPTKG